MGITSLLTVFLFCGFSLLYPVQALEPTEVLSDLALEARARAVSQQLRCVVCQNQSIDESNADLAHDMRVLVRRRIVAGDTDQGVIQFLVDRYGDFVTLTPPFRPSTWILWMSPIIFLVIAAAAMRGFLSQSDCILRESSTSQPSFSDDERNRLRELMQDNRRHR